MNNSLETNQPGVAVGGPVQLSIAGIGIEVTSSSQNLLRSMARHYAAFCGTAPGAVKLAITWKNETRVEAPFQPEIHFSKQEIRFQAANCLGIYAPAAGAARLEFDSAHSFEFVEYFLRVITAVRAYEKGGFLFHGAGILHNGLGVIFFGPSGSGKTTVSRLSQADQVLNDDLVLLLPADGRWMVHSTPFWNPTQVKPQPVEMPLNGLFRLVQDKRVFCEKPSLGRALAEVTSNIPVLCTDPQRGPELMNRAQRILETVPVYRLHFLPDLSFWVPVEQSLGRQI